MYLVKNTMELTRGLKCLPIYVLWTGISCYIPHIVMMNLCISIFYSSDSQLGQFCPPKGHLSMNGDTFGCNNREG